MRNALEEISLWDTTGTVSGSGFDIADITLAAPLKISLNNSESLLASNLTAAFSVTNEGTDPVSVRVDCHGFSKTFLAPAGETTYYDALDHIALYLAARNTENVTDFTITVSPTRFFANYALGAAVSVVGVPSSVSPTPLEMVLSLINDYLVTNNMIVEPLLLTELTFDDIYPDPNDSDKTLIDITVLRAGDLAGPRRCRYSRLEASLLTPSPISVTNVPFGVNVVADLLPDINAATSVTYLPNDFTNATISNPLPGQFVATCEASNHHIFGSLDLALPEGFNNYDTKYRYFGTHPDLGALQTNNFNEIYECVDESVPGSSYLTDLFPGRNKKLYALEIGTDTRIHRSYNGGGKWQMETIESVSTDFTMGVFFKERFYFVGVAKDTGVLCLFRFREDSEGEPDRAQYVMEIPGNPSSDNVRLFANEEHIGLTTKYETEVAYTYATQIIYSADAAIWTTEELLHGLATTSDYIGAGSWGFKIAQNGNKVYLFGSPSLGYADYAVSMITMFSELGTGVWNVDTQPLYADTPEYLIQSNVGDTSAQFLPLPDGRIMMYVNRRDGGSTPTRSYGDIHVFDPTATAGSRWTNLLMRTGIDQARLVGYGNSIALVGGNYNDSSYGGGPHSNAFSTNLGDAWEFDLNVASFQPYYSVATIDDRPALTALNPELSANALASQVEAPFLEQLAGQGGGTMITRMIVDSTGKLYVGGIFENFLGKSYLVRLNNDGTLDTGFNPSFINTLGYSIAGVSHMALDETNDRIYIAGPNFTAGGTHQNFACLSTVDGSVDGDFTTIGPTINVTGLTVGAGGWLYFSSANLPFSVPSAYPGIHRVGLDGTLDTTFELTDVDGRDRSEAEPTYLPIDRVIGTLGNGNVLVSLQASKFSDPTEVLADVFIDFCHFDNTGLVTPVELVYTRPDNFEEMGTYLPSGFLKTFDDGTSMFTASQTFGGGGGTVYTKAMFLFNSDGTLDDSFTFRKDLSNNVGGIVDVVKFNDDGSYGVLVTGAVKPTINVAGGFIDAVGFMELDATGTEITSSLPVFFEQDNLGHMADLGSNRYFISLNNVDHYYYRSTAPRQFVSRCRDYMFVTRT